MKRILLSLCILLFLVAPIFADVDTKDGSAITTTSNADGSSDSHDVADGIAISSGAVGCNFSTTNPCYVSADNELIYAIRATGTGNCSTNCQTISGAIAWDQVSGNGPQDGIALGTDLTTRAVRVVFELYNDWSGGLVDTIVFDGTYTNPVDDTYDITIRAADDATRGAGTQGSNSHNFVGGAGAYVKRTGGTPVISISGLNYINITGIGVESTYTGNGNDRCIFMNNLGTIDSCWFKSTESTPIMRSMVYNKGIVQNSLFYNSYVSLGDALGALRLSNNSTASIHNTFYGISTGHAIDISANWINVVIKENVAYNCTSGQTFFSYNGTGTFAYNATEDSTYNVFADATNFQLTGDPFVNSGSLNFAVAAGTNYGAEVVDQGGSSGAGVTWDAIGNSRPVNTNYDVGWCEEQ